MAGVMDIARCLGVLDRKTLERGQRYDSLFFLCAMASASFG